MSQAPPLRTQHRYYPELDGVRAIAALLVMLFHAQQEGLSLRFSLGFGQTGVDLFFVLSGFLITSILLKAAPRDWSEVRTFYTRRALRIFPLYYVTLILCWILLSRPSWFFWVYLQNFWISFGKISHGPMHFWSLAVEEQFYLVWPFLVIFVPRKRLLPILTGTIVFAAVLRFVLAAFHQSVFVLTFTRLDGLAAGAVLATLNARGPLTRWARLMLSIAGLSTVAAAILGHLFRDSNNPSFVAIKYTLITAIYTCLMGSLLSRPNSRAVKLLSMRWLRWIGRISYGLYVFHPFVFAWTYRHFPGQPMLLRAGLATVFTFAIAAFSWYSFERWFIRLKEVLSPERRPTPAEPITV
ncbi:MAG TPA: acyltransferase [Acidobacteriaceae bacterium]|nr:acyltransferase [Acidobacteriaceae bacterium]